MTWFVQIRDVYEPDGGQLFFLTHKIEYYKYTQSIYFDVGITYMFTFNRSHWTMAWLLDFLGLVKIIYYTHSIVIILNIKHCTKNESNLWNIFCYVINLLLILNFRKRVHRFIYAQLNFVYVCQTLTVESLIGRKYMYIYTSYICTVMI